MLSIGDYSAPYQDEYVKLSAIATRIQFIYTLIKKTIPNTYP